jgi:Mrp family chromosome partitioning ATPase
MNSPTEINNSRKVGEFISNLAESFENVLIDSPPLLAVSETSLISSLVENTLLVVKSNETNKDVLNKAQQHLQQVGGSFTGIILNDGSDKQVGYGGYYSDYKQKVPQNGASKSGLKTFTRN